MYLMYYLDESGNRCYTLKVIIEVFLTLLLTVCINSVTM